MISLRTGLVYGNLLLLGLTSYHAASFGMERLGSELKRRTLPPSVRAVRVAGQSTRVKVLLRDFQPLLAPNAFKPAPT